MINQKRLTLYLCSSCSVDRQTVLDLSMINRFSPILYINRIFCGDVRKVKNFFFLNSKAVNKHGHVVFHDFRKQIINS